MTNDRVERSELVERNVARAMLLLRGTGYDVVSRESIDKLTTALKDAEQDNERLRGLNKQLTADYNALLIRSSHERTDAERKNDELSKLIVEQEREYHKGRKDAERALNEIAKQPCDCNMGHRQKVRKAINYKE